MPAPLDRLHLIVPATAVAESYTPHDKSFQLPAAPAPADRARHAEKLTLDLQAVLQDGSTRRAANDVVVQDGENGLYVEFLSPPGVTLKATSLENSNAGIKLVALVDHAGLEGAPDTQSATVFVPEGKLNHFVGRLQEYVTEKTETGKPKNLEMVDRIAAIRLASLAAIWTDDDDLFPDGDTPIWWEVWLRHSDGKVTKKKKESNKEKVANRFKRFAATAGLTVGDQQLTFADRIVILAHGTPNKLAKALDTIPDLAEVRKAKASAAFFDALPASEQAGWAADLAARTTPPPPNAPSACILDTGVNRGHKLLSASLAATDVHSYNRAWGVEDVYGHGTGMAGLALYGDLRNWLADRSPISLWHGLESVKILPNPGNANPPNLYGAITVDAAARVEIQAPFRRRCFVLAITTDDNRDRGRPSSWSATIDALAAGRTIDAHDKGLTYIDGPRTPRLFLVSGGNADLDGCVDDMLANCDGQAIQDPGQAWNALTIGACTSLVNIGPFPWGYSGYRVLAPYGELSPHSTTSVSFGSSWPIKPEVVFEGGNVAIAPGDLVDDTVPDLNLLTTSHEPAKRSFDRFNATSAASAQVARIAAMVPAYYPALWPETIRALIVHSAEWTDAMKARFNVTTSKRARLNLLRRYGFGVPNLMRVLRSANDAVTLLVQGTIHPYAKGKLREMQIHDLPWPREVLKALGEERVRLRITLSYFVEPNPARRGWGTRYRYASHALRFEVIGPTEDPERFRKRLNKRALEDGEPKPEAAEDDEWYLGFQARTKGSLHSDVWEGTAADLALRGHIAIFPVGGWWKDQPRHDQSEAGVRYALVVSIETTATDVDLWTPIATEIGVPIEY